ncbi:MAG: MFS transporter [Planctomycetota bacterium]|jgi:MFS family permease
MPAANSHATLLGISSFQILAMFRRGLFYTFLSIYLRQFLGLSMTETTLFATLPMIMNVSFQLFVWGRVSDALQLRRTLIVLGEVLAAFGTVALWYAHTLAGGGRAAGYVIIGGLAVIEVFWSMSNIGWSALISDWYRREDRTAVQAELASIGAVGRIVGVWIGGLLYDGLGMQYEGWGFSEGMLFFVAAGAMLLSTVPMLFVGEGGIEEGGIARAAESAPEADSVQREPGSAQGANGFVTFLLAMVLINFGRNAVTVIRAPYLTLETGFALSSRSLSHVVNTRSVTIVVVGVLVARLGKRVAASRGLVLGTCVAAGSLIVLAFAQRLWLVYVSSVMTGIADVMIMASAYTLASVLIPPDRRGRLFAWFNATTFLSWGLAGTLIAGPVVDALVAKGATETFAYKASFVAAAGVTLVGLAVLVFLALGPAPPRDAAGADA